MILIVTAPGLTVILTWRSAYWGSAAASDTQGTSTASHPSERVEALLSSGAPSRHTDPISSPVPGPRSCTGGCWTGRGCTVRGRRPPSGTPASKPIPHPPFPLPLVPSVPVRPQGLPQGPLFGLFLSLLLATLVLPSPVQAQALSSSAEPFTTPTWAVDAGLAGANALFGGTVVSLARWIRGEPLGEAFREGFAGGALAGVAAYGGKRLAAARFTGAGLLGRQLHGAAAASTRSVAAGGGLTDELTLFLGPLRFHLHPGRGADDGRWSVSGLDFYWIAYGVADSRFSLDWGESLSGGAPVFRPELGRRIVSGSEQPRGGVALGGVVFISDGLGEAEPRLLAHERVHALQFDFLHSVVSQPIERHLLGRVPGGDRVRSRLHPDLLILGVGALLGSRAESRRSPWEVEAHLLEGR
jgi:hypothetical protein